MSSNAAAPLVGAECPFQVMGIVPTLDLAEVKRAYFAGLAKHPPHQDPEGFRRLRAAYEALTLRGGLALACARSPIDVGTWMTAWNDRFAAPLARAAEDANRSESAATQLAAFIETTSRLSFAEARRASAPPLPLL
jgi:hypothetical protein